MPTRDPHDVPGIRSVHGLRIAWFSPMPPVRSGVAVCSAELVAALRADHDIDVFVDEPLVSGKRQSFVFATSAASAADSSAKSASSAADASAKSASSAADASARSAPSAAAMRSAHDFVWLHAQRPYDLTVYQVGNSSHHDYLWPYLFRYPGLAVLHDAQLHHARAAALLRAARVADYRSEFAANHPGVNADAAELAVAGFDNHLYYMWPMTRLVVQASKLTAVHTRQIAAELRAEVPGAAVEAIRLGHGVEVDATREADARSRVRRRYAVPADAVLFGCFGGLTPDKRIPQVLGAFAALLPYAPDARLMLAGARASHYDVAADVESRGLGERVTLTGHVDEKEFTDCIAACDVTLNLRWPTARELSGPWLRCLAAGKPTIVIDLAHVTEVCSLDPRTWRVQTAIDTPQGFVGSPSSSGELRTASCDPITVAIDILDEDHSLRLAMRRLASDAALRSALGRAGQAWWPRGHSFAPMLDDYRRAIAAAHETPAPRVELPLHLLVRGDRVLREIAHAFGLEPPIG